MFPWTPGNDRTDPVAVIDTRMHPVDDRPMIRAASSLVAVLAVSAVASASAAPSKPSRNGRLAYATFPAGADSCFRESE